MIRTIPETWHALGKDSGTWQRGLLRVAAREIDSV